MEDPLKIDNPYGGGFPRRQARNFPPRAVDQTTRRPPANPGNTSNGDIKITPSTDGKNSSGQPTVKIG